MPLPLYEKYRPQTLDDVIGQDAAIKTIKHLQNRDALVGKVFWIVGQSSSGKTTLARIIAGLVADPYAVQEFPADDLVIDRIRDIERRCQMRPIGKGIHCFILNEAHLLRGPILARLNTTFEDPCVQRNSTWIFTTTTAGQKKLFDEDEIEQIPFGSRTIKITLNQVDNVRLAEHARAIAQQESCDGKPLGDYIELVKKCQGNLRDVLNHIESGYML